MGQLHNELRRGPLSAALSNILGDTRGGGLERYGETLQPILDMWGRPEWAFARQETRFIGNEAVAAVAAQNANVGLRNPAADSLVVPEWVFYIGTAPHFLQLGLNETPDTTQVLPAADTRWYRGAAPGLGRTRVQLLERSQVGVVGDVTIARLPDGTAPGQFIDLRPLGIVLAPNYELWLVATLVNTALEVTFAGYSRAARPGELD